MKNYTTPDLNSLLQILKNDVMASLRTMTIGRVIDFDHQKRTITAEICIYPTSVQLNPEISNRGELEYPTLYEVPVLDCEYFQPPIHADDYCLLIFAERNIDNWLVEDDGYSEPRDKRMHSIADAFAWFGIGNYLNSTFIKPDGYEPPHDLPEICDCPIPKYGYQPDLARVRYDVGEINLGYEPVMNGGVTIVARDYTNVNMYAEGSDGNPYAGNINLFPTNSVNINNDQVQIIIHGDSDDVLDPDNITSGVDNPPIDPNGGGKITIFNQKSHKTITQEDPDVPEPNNWWLGKEVYTSDMYRAMAQCKACLSEASKLLAGLGADTHDLDGAITEFKTRYKNLFAPADPMAEEENV